MRSLTLPSSLNNHTLRHTDLLQKACLHAFTFYVQQHKTGNPTLLTDLILFQLNNFSPWLFWNIAKPWLFLENHRVIEWFELQGTFQISPQLPCHGLGHLPLNQDAQGLIYLVLNTSGEQSSTTSLGNLVQCLTTPTVKNFVLMSNLNLASLSWKPFSSI